MCSFSRARTTVFAANNCDYVYLRLDCFIHLHLIFSRLLRSRLLFLFLSSSLVFQCDWVLLKTILDILAAVELKGADSEIFLCEREKEKYKNITLKWKLKARARNARKERIHIAGENQTRRFILTLLNDEINSTFGL